MKKPQLFALLAFMCACAVAPENGATDGGNALDSTSKDSSPHMEASAQHDGATDAACNAVVSIAPLVAVQQSAASPPPPLSPYVDANCQLLRAGIYILKSRTFYTGSASTPVDDLGLISLTLMVTSRQTSTDPNGISPYFDWAWVETHQASLTSVGSETRSDAIVQTTGNDNCFTQTVMQSNSCGAPTLGPAANFFNDGNTLWYYHPYGLALWIDAGIVDEYDLVSK